MRYFHGFLWAAAIAVSATAAAAQHADPALNASESSAQRSGLDTQRPEASTPSTPSKLSTVLAALAQSITQATSAARGATPSQAQALDAASKPVKDAIQGGWMRLNARQEVQVYILMTAVTDDTVGQLTTAGATIEIRDAARRRVQARVPASLLQAVSNLGIVNAIRLPTYGRRRTGAVTSEGDTILYADNVRSQLTLDGTGVRVGVVSDGLKGVFATGCASCTGATTGPIASGDLPTATGVRNANGVLTSSTGGILGKSFQANGDLEGLPPASPVCGDPGAGAEGTALLEIVHDLAPGAQLSFANGDTDLAFAQAVSFLAASTDVVLDDIGFYGEPYDGTSFVSSNTAAALNNPAYPIRAYFTAAGNDADEHYDGTYTDSGIDGTTVSGIGDTGHLHLFQRTADTTDVLGLGPRAYNLIQLPQNGEVAIFLTWDDAFGASANNYDLYLVQQSTGRVVASSTDVQSGKQDPSEFIDYVNPGAQDYFRIIVQNVHDAARPAHLNLFSFQPQCATAGPTVLAPPAHDRHNFNTASRSVSAQSDAGGTPVSVVAVGAICSASAGAASAFGSDAPDASCLDTSHSTPEFFSSRGPTLDGRVKPDISGIDGVSVTGAGGFSAPFFGTSAAAPHLGAIAALLLQGAPCLMNRAASTIDPASARGTVRNMLLGHAIGLGGPVPDNNVGVGRIDAFAAVNATLPLQQGARSLTVDANTPFGAALTASQLGFTDPDGCAVKTLNWTGACGTAPGSTMTCPVGTSSVSVSASNNGIAFSAATDMQITVTDFSISVAPNAGTISSGGSAQYVVTVSPQGGAFKSPVTLTCANGSLPSGANCSFNPPTLTPGASAVQSILTITTTKSSFAAPVWWTRIGQMTRGASRAIASGPMAAWPIFGLLLMVSLAGAMRCHMPSTFTVRFIAACVAGTACLAAVVVMAPAVLAQSGIAVFPDTLNFPSQPVSTTTAPEVLYVTNIGVTTLNISSIAAAGDFSTVTDCGTTLAVGQSCGIAISFTPTDAGARTGTLTITDDAAGSPHTVTLNGTGQAAPSTGRGTAPGSYTVAVSGVAGTMTHAAPLTLAVQ